MPPRRIALIHATPLAVEPIESAFQRLWPRARRMNLLDDSLSTDRAEAGGLTQGMVRRFETLARYAQDAGCDGILFTCSAFGPAIEAAARATALPTLKPNEAMFGQALAMHRPGRTLRLGLLATFQPSLPSMSAELEQLARDRGAAVELRTLFVPEAMDDLARGRPGEHHRKVAQAAARLEECDVLMLAQFSMSAARDEAQARVRAPVLSSPDCAVQALMRTMGDV